MFERFLGRGGSGAKTEHPLAVPREVRRIVDELPVSDAFKALDEIVGCLESALNAGEFPANRLCEALCQLDDAAQPRLRWLAREYLQSVRLTRGEERRLWTIIHGFWTVLAAAYERCLGAAVAGEQGGQAMKAALPGLCARLISALGGVLKWQQFHYSPSAGELWQRLGAALLAAEAAGVATNLVPLRGGTALSSAQQEYIRILALQAASTDSLLPPEIELAERLIARFQAGFVFSAVAEHDSVYWVDLALAQPPHRLARMPQQVSPTQRFFKPAAGHAGIAALLHDLERGGELPPEIELGAHCHAGTPVAVLRHLAACLAPVPPQRRHGRYSVKQRAVVVHGLASAHLACGGQVEGGSSGMPMESWVVDDISRGGFGATLDTLPGEWLAIGALIAMRPEGSSGWQIGIVRRYQRLGDALARVGIETLALRATVAEVRARAASSYALMAGTAALLIDEGNVPGELRALLPASSFDLREILEYTIDGRLQVLIPVELVERGVDYDLARFRVAVPA